MKFGGEGKAGFYKGIKVMRPEQVSPTMGDGGRFWGIKAHGAVGGYTDAKAVLHNIYFLNAVS